MNSNTNLHPENQLQTTQYIVQFSGGVGSFAAACYCIKKYGRENTHLLFADTKMEDEDLYRFLNETEKFLGIPITRICEGRDPWQVFEDVKYLGNSRIDPCSRILKREFCRKWIEQNYPNPDSNLVQFVIGIDWIEQHRLINAIENWKPYTIIAPLVDDIHYDKNKFMNTMEKDFGIKRPRLYEMGFSHNNCGGFCIKAGKAHFLNLLKNMPERYKYHEEREIELREKMGFEYTILRETVNKEQRYLTLRELRERSEEIARTEEGQYDIGGCGCFL
jgi:hypothetical protein